MPAAMFRPRLALSFAAALLALAPGTARAQEPCRCAADAPADTGELARLPAPPTSRFAPSGAGALPLEFVLPGMRVRLDAPGYVHSRALIGRREGVILAVRGDTLLFDGARHRELVLVPVSQIRTLDVSTGRGPSADATALSGLVGAAIGGGLGVLVNLNRNDGGEPSCTGSLVPACTPELRNVAIGAFVGAVTGALVGRRIPHHQWRRVALR